MHRGGDVNEAPTVIITRAPTVITDADSARFCWVGSDRDGKVVRYYYAVDDSTTGVWTESTAVTVYNLALGEHLFFVRAEDDSGARSIMAVAAFRVDYEGAIPSLGSDSALEIVTWNIQNFPKSGESTLVKLQRVISRLDLDLYCIQEIEDTLAFLRLLGSLPGYRGFYSRDDYGAVYQKTGVIYKTDIFTISGVHQIFYSNESFPRPPLVMDIVAAHNGGGFQFRLIVLHLKAGSDPESRARRAGACRQLKAYLDSLIQPPGEQKIVVAGDWNDELDVPAEENVFSPFLADTANYRFLTLPLAGNEYYASLVNYTVLFDHILINTAARREYTGGRTVTIRLDDQITDYERLISDHRPVMATFPVFR